MNPMQRSMCGQLARLMADFYANPENERRYQEWLEAKKKRGPATNDDRAPSITGQPEAYHRRRASC